VSREESSGTAWLLAAVWQLKGVTQNTDKGRCPSGLVEKEVKHILVVQGGSNMTGTDCV
jgi:hypothetical protein